MLFDNYVLDSDRGNIAAIEPEAGIVSIAVLPLDIFNNDSEKQYLADGMTASLITELSKIEALRVISRTSILKYRGGAMSLPIRVQMTSLYNQNSSYAPFLVPGLVAALFQVLMCSVVVLSIGREFKSGELGYWRHFFMCLRLTSKGV